MDTKSELINQRVDRMTKLLRVSGSLLLVASASSFMLQRWDNGTDVTKFLYLLAHTAAALVAGLLCGGTLRESRAARTFLLLAVAIVPMNFAVAGAFAYGRFGLDSASLDLPGFASWVAPSTAVALSLIAATAVLGTLVTLIASTPLVRGRVQVYALRFLLANAIILVPLRQPEFAGLLTLLAAGVALSFELLVAPNDSRLRTPEGRLLRALLWVPALIILGRSAFFYDASAFLYAPVSTALGLMLFFGARKQRDAELSTAMEAMGAVLAGASWLPLALQIKAQYFPYLHFHPLTAVPVSVILIGLSHFAQQTRRGLQSAATVIALGASLLAVLIEPSMLSGLVTVMVGLIAVCHGMLRSTRWVEIPALLVACSGMICCVAMAVGAHGVLNWGSLSALGAGLVLGSALIERRRVWLVRKVLRAELQLKADLAHAADLPHAEGTALGSVPAQPTISG